MEKTFTKNWFLVLLVLALGAIVPARAQTYTSKVLGTNLGVSAMCKDAAGNVYVIQTVSTAQSSTQQNAQIVKYAAGTTTGTVLTGTTFQFSEYESVLNYAFGIGIDSGGNIFVTTYNDYFPSDGRDVTTYGKILKFTPSGVNTYTQSTWVTGQYPSGNKIGDFGGLVIDSHDNIFVDAYNDVDGKYEVVKYPSGSTTPSVIFTHVGDANLVSGDHYGPFPALAIDGSDNLYVATNFDTDNNSDGGKIFKLTASSSYTSSTTSIINNAYCTALTCDATGSLYATIATYTVGSGLTSSSVVKYSSDFSTTTTLYSNVSHNGSWEPWGISVPSSSLTFAGAGGGPTGTGHLGDLAVIFSAPSTQATNVSFSSTTEKTTSISWTNGNGASRAVFVKAGTGGSPTLTNSTTYTAATAFGSGTQAGSGWYCVYNGTGTSVSVSNLTAASTYTVMAVEYNGVAGAENYFTTAGTGNPNTVTTASNPALTASGAAPTYSVGGSAVTVDNGITISGGTGTLSTATVSVSTAFASGDALNFVNQNGITGSYNSGTGVLTLSGSASLANYQTALQSVTFSSSSASTTTRGVSFLVGDGVANSSTVSKNISISTSTTISSINLASSSPTNATTVNFTATFASSVTGVTASNFSLTTTGVTGASIGTVTGSGTTWTIPVTTGTGDGTIKLNLANATGISPGISTTLPFAGSTYTIDKTAPTVAITRTDGNPTNANVIDFQAVFSEAVTNVDPTDFVMTNSGVTTGTISVTAINSTTYNISVINVTGDGTARLDLKSGTNIIDAAGNGPAAYTSGEVYTVDQTVPVIFGTSSFSANNTPSDYAKTGNIITLNAIYNEHVTISSFVIGGHAVTPVNTTGNTWRATYTVTSADPEGHMTFEIIAADDAGNTLDATSANVTINGVYVTIDNTLPTVSIGAPSLTLTKADPVSYTVTYNDLNFSASTLSSGDITVNSTGTATAGTIAVTGTGDTRTVTLSNISGDGTLGISIAAGTGADKSGNLTAAAGPSTTFKVFNTVPTNIALSPAAIDENLASGTTVGAFSTTGVNTAAGDTYTYSLVTGTGDTDNGSFTIDGSGNLKSAASFNYEVKNSYSILVRTTDAVGLTFDKQLTVAINNINDAPVAVNDSYTTIKNVPLTVSSAANGVLNNDTDEDGNTLTAVLVSGPAHGSLTLNANGTFTFTPSGGYSGTDSFTYKANDGTVDGNTATVNITINNSVISLDAGSLTAMSTTYGTASASQNFTVSGTNLIAGILVTPPTGFEVSTDNSSFSPTVTLPLSGNNVSSTTVYIRLKATAAANTYAASNVVLSSSNASNVNVPTASSTVSPYAITITANDVPKTYGQTLSNVTGSTAFSSTALVNGETVGQVNIGYGTGAAATDAVGTYTGQVTPSSASGGTFTAGNYSITYAKGKITIGQRTLNVFATGVNKPYDGANTATVNLTDDRVTGDTFTANYTSASFASPNVANGITVSVSGIGISGGASANYSLGNTTATTSANITQAAVTVTATGPAKSYGTALTAGTSTTNFTVGTGLATGESITGVTLTPDAAGLSATTTAGSAYVVTPSAATGTGGFATGNYNVNYVPFNGTVGTSTQTITFNALAGATYGDAPITLTGTASSGLTVTYNSSNTAVATVSGNTVTIVGAGSTTITAAQAGDGNYTAATSVPQTLNVATKSLTVTATGVNKTYDGTATATVNFSDNRVTGDTFTTSSTANFNNKNVGPGKTINVTGISISGGKSANYTLSNTTASASAAITAKAINVTAQTDSKGYDATTSSSVAPVVDALATGDAIATAPVQNFDTPAKGTGKTLTPSGLIINDGNNGDNYAVSYVTNTTGTITARAITVTAGTKTKTYGSIDPALTYSITTGSLAGADAFTGALARTTGEAVGSYPINQGTLALSSNYTLTYVGANLSITQFALTITATGPLKSYGTALTAGTSATNFTAGATVGSEAVTSVTLTPDAAGLSATTAAGSPYVVTPSAATGTNGFSAANYNINYVAYNGTVSTTSQTITFNALANATYGDTPITLTGAASSGLAVSYASSNTAVATVSGSTLTVVGAGTTTITASQAGNSNYTAATSVPQTLTVNARAITVTAAAQSKTYGAVDPVLTYSVTTGSLVGTDAFTGTLTRDAGQNVGVYAIKQGSLALSSNYALTYAGANLTIGKASLTIKPDNQSRAYGAANPTLTVGYTGLVNGDVASSLTTQPTVTTTAINTSPVGSYAINASGAASGNYNISYTAGSLSVTQAALTITATGPLKSYGTALTAGTSTTNFTAGTTANGETVTSVTLTPDAAGLSATTAAGSPYVVTPSAATGANGFSAANYNVNYVAYNGTVSTTSQTITFSALANATYGDAPITLTGTASSGLTVSYASSNTAVATVSGNKVTILSAGTTTITASQAGNSNYTAAANVPQTLTVNPRAVTVIAAAQTKVYGTTDPALTYSISSGTLVGSDAFTGALTRNAGQNVGTYAITQGTLTLGGNYALTYTGANLTITKAALNITANNQTKVYGAANPALTVAYSGFVNGDNSAALTTQPTVVTTATASSAVGSYPITASGAASGNYNISYTAGALTVTNATLTIAANNQTKVYGAANPALTVSYTGFVNGDTQASLTTQPTVVTTATTASGVNTYPITASGAAIANYTIAYTAGTLTVTKAPLTVTADNKSRLFGVANPALTITYSGFVNSESASNLTTQATATTAATTTTLPGSYPITVGGAASGNYSFIYVNGSLTIIPLSNANLNSLSVSSGPLSPAFSTAVTSYSTSVTYDVDHVFFTPVFDPTASIRINGSSVNNGGSFNMPLNAGNNTVTLVVTAQDGVTTKTYMVSVYRAIPPDAVTATNILTPNGDGKNDTWVIKDINLYPNNTVTVYDRGGRVIYAKHGYNNEWDGTLRGASLSEGTYYYTIDLGVQARTIKGFITILKSN
ncbi:gliding motility-associated-like protein [Mucilaginibacter yixingensis]|uniref:Gliding motility-associated-like protein n=1 Tax=Mucilaginibacter yixingensis TaxID=1295612 RepID=A0A2T5JG65_9SPHI|nr:MBG domain-containing protein [Mucilaginibacter yixingensis]PTR01411.1 gliding motility-associated-like protein [Mucilaginibacter yixingensis]